MKYSSECGTALSSQATVCPSCGALLPAKADKSKVYSDLMEKGKDKSLQTDAQELVESPSNVSTNTNKGFSNTETNDAWNEKSRPETNVPSNKNNVSRWIGVYLMLNLILVSFVYYDIINFYPYIDYSDLTNITYLPERILSQDIYFLLSVVILLSVLKRRGMTHPFNWFLKTLLILQICLSGYMLYLNTQIMVLMNINFLMFALLITNIILLFKGNRD
jgi:hypothetical protein